jgi:hypothetical protein
MFERRLHLDLQCLLDREFTGFDAVDAEDEFLDCC